MQRKWYTNKDTDPSDKANAVVIDNNNSKKMTFFQVQISKPTRKKVQRSQNSYKMNSEIIYWNLVF